MPPLPLISSSDTLAGGKKPRRRNLFLRPNYFAYTKPSQLRHNKIGDHASRCRVYILGIAALYIHVTINAY